MKEICKNSEIASFLDAAWHDPIKETPNKDGALCIVCDGVDENGKDTYDLFTWDNKMKAFDTVVGRYVDEDLKNKHVLISDEECFKWCYKHVLISTERCFKWCYLEDLLPEPKEIGERTEADPAKLAKRFWLRKELYKYYGASHIEDMEEAFNWIYNAPLKDWENMLLCITHPDNKTFPKPLKDAKKLFDLLS